MAKVRHMAQGAPLNEWFLDMLQEELSDYVGGGFAVTQASATSLQVVAGAGAAQVSIAVQNPAGTVLGLRHNTSTVTASVPGGLAVGVHDIYVTASANSFASNPTPPPNELDNTDYSFGLALLASGGTPGTAYYRKVGTFGWDGSKITGVTVTVGGQAGDVPIGGSVEYGGTADPSASWMVEDGRALSRTTYAVLFQTIGVAYGAGNGTTTFNIPDSRGRAAVGVDGAAGRLTANDALGQAGGEEKHTLSVAELPAHDHALQMANAEGTSAFPQESGGTVFDAGGGGFGSPVKNTGGDVAHNNMQPYVVKNKIIRVL